MPGLWGKLRHLAVTDVGALLRGLPKAELREFERTLIEADLGVAAAGDLVAEVQERVRRGKVKTADDVRAALEERLVAILAQRQSIAALDPASSGVSSSDRPAVPM